MFSRKILFGFLGAIVALSFVGFFTFDNSTFPRASAGAEHNVLGWGWADNIGWVSFNCEDDDTCAVSNYGVNMDEDTGLLSGYAWANPYDAFGSGTNNIGWITFNQSELVGCPSGTCEARLIGDTLVGWARAIGGDTGGINEEDPEPGDWGSEYGAPANNDTTPPGNEDLAYSCTDGISGTFIDVERVSDGGVDESDNYGSWGPEYPAPANLDGTPAQDNVNPYQCTNGENGTYTDVRLVSDGGTGGLEGWTSKSPLNYPRTNTVTESVNGKIYVITGHEGNSGGTANRRNEDYNPETNSWSLNSQAPTDLRVESAAGAVHGNNIHIIGGFNDLNLPDGGVNEHWRYNTVSDSYTELAPLPVSNWDGGAATIGSKIYYVAGYHYQNGSYQFDDELYIYNTQTNTWSNGPARPFAGSLFTVDAVDGKLYVIGGFNSWNKVQIYNPATNSWSLGSDVPNAAWTSKHASAAVDSKIYIYGGEEYLYDNSLNNTWAYDTVSNSWEQKDDLPANREQLGGAAVGCKVYAISGTVDPGAVWNRQSSVYEFTTSECGTPSTYQDRTVQCNSIPQNPTYHDREVQCVSGGDFSGWDGWISLSGDADNGETYAVNLLGNAFDGFAWGDDVIGWLSFDGVTLRNPDDVILQTTLRGNTTGFVNSNPGNIVCNYDGVSQSGDCDEEYTEDDLITLAASIKLYGWSSNCVPGVAQSCQVTMNQSKTVTATFFDDELGGQCSDGIDNNEDGLIDDEGGFIRPGDVNQDSAYSVEDVTTCFKYADGTYPITDFALIAADMDDSGSIDSSDCETVQSIAVGLTPAPSPVAVGPEPSCVAPEEEEEFTLTTGVLDPEVGRRVAVLTDPDGDGTYTLSSNCLSSSCDYVFDAGLAIRLSGILWTDFEEWVGLDASLCPNINQNICDFTLDQNTIIKGRFVGSEPQEEVCGDGIDNDGDGQVDENCPTGDEICGDGIDNDGDGQIDEGCDDGGPGGGGDDDDEICGDGIDNDGDGQIDEGCNDGGPDGEICGDGVDNDGDTLVDEGCNGEGGPDCPADGVGVCPVCNDGEDNDGDGLTDLEDPVCANNPFRQSEGVDDNVEEI